MLPVWVKEYVLRCKDKVRNFTVQYTSKQFPTYETYEF